MLDAIDQSMAALCEVDGCLPPWYTDLGPYCFVFASLSPGVPGVVDVGWDGDVSIGGRQVTDCYPYDGGAEFDLSDTYAAAVQVVYDVLNVLCAVVACPPPPYDPIDPRDVVGEGVVVVGQVLGALCDADVCTSEGPVLCPWFARLSPGPSPDVVIGPDGDVEIDGRLVYSCPPYGSR